MEDLYSTLAVRELCSWSRVFTTQIGHVSVVTVTPAMIPEMAVPDEETPSLVAKNFLEISYDVNQIALAGTTPTREGGGQPTDRVLRLIGGFDGGEGDPCAQTELAKILASCEDALKVLACSLVFTTSSGNVQVTPTPPPIPPATKWAHFGTSFLFVLILLSFS
eukprot:CAMPEP_0184363486 /NCGR_PEP_ID=MMETSP1089-20130417/139964_1 /TAXON_ID=38269 ORGANISM="Gloeochaete wittrockiana, Strain SAG46.84" /NCGR_SAMPLE_ID=MMETSP1089 /ASSEMBLY_ACC=CAM_ASM_000445 /LENGTH=163 /DNA_ID=CAMNT_0026703995 /DNA_START=31 /DNA_END=522 /DNA_ORIENTATION=-